MVWAVDYSKLSETVHLALLGLHGYLLVRSVELFLKRLAIVEPRPRWQHIMPLRVLVVVEMIGFGLAGWASLLVFSGGSAPPWVSEISGGALSFPAGMLLWLVLFQKAPAATAAGSSAPPAPATSDPSPPTPARPPG